MAEQSDLTAVQQSLVDSMPPKARRRARRNAWLYLGAAVVLLPWIGYLAVSLPKRNLDLHYRAAWVGFDIVLVAALLITAYMAFRVDPRIELPATITATLLLVDAWFDITTSNGKAELLQALVLAAFLEIPAAIFSLRLAQRVEHRVFEQAGLLPARPERPRSKTEGGLDHRTRVAPIDNGSSNGAPLRNTADLQNTADDIPAPE